MSAEAADTMPEPNVFRNMRPTGPTFTFEQLAAIRRGVMAGREAMRKRPPPSALVFFDGFSKANAVHVPGIDLRPEYQKILASCVLMQMDKGDELRKTWSWINADMVMTIKREICRADMEAGWAKWAARDDVVGFRFLMKSDITDIVACGKFLECDNYGMGPGVWPKHEIVVLPPCCDGRLEMQVVYAKA